MLQAFYAIFGIETLSCALFCMKSHQLLADESGMMIGQQDAKGKWSGHFILNIE